MGKRIVDEDLRFNIIINGNKAQKELYDLEKRNRSLLSTNKNLRAEQAKLIKQGEKKSQAYENLSKEIRQNNAELKRNKERISQLQKEIGVTGLTLKQLRSRARELKFQLANMIPGSNQYEKLKAELKQVEKQLGKVSLRAKYAKTSLSRFTDGFNKYAALGASVIATLTGVAVSIQKVIDYNGKLSDAESDVIKTTSLTKKEIKELHREFGLLKTRTARIELLQLAEEAGRLGITGVKNIRDFVEVANQIKVALGDDLGEKQIREIGKMVSIYGVGEKMGRNYKNSLLSLGSAINEVSAKGTNQAGFLVEYIKRQAGIAAQTQLSAENNIAYAATFDELGQSVEVSATAMNKVWTDMFKNSQTYAEIAGVNLEDFVNLLNTDANAAMIAFLKGLNGNNEGLSVMLQKMEDLEAGGTRGVAALSALASNVELLEKRQGESNKAMREATSLTNEYRLKNNNLAATLSKIKKNIVGAFSSNKIANSLNSILKGIERLTRATNQNEKAAKRERLELIKLESQLFSTNIPAEERIKLIEQLKKEYPRYLSDIDAETVSNERLRASLKKINEEMINRIVIARKEDEIEAHKEKAADAAEEKLKQQERLSNAVANVVSKLGEEFQFDETKTEYQNAIALANKWIELNGKSTSFIKQSTSGYFELKNALSGYRLAQGELNVSMREGNKLISERDKLMADLGIVPDEEGTQTPSTPTVTSTFTAPSSKKKSSKKSNRASELLAIQRAMEDARIALIKDAFEREMAMEEANHRRKIEDLKAKKIKENLIRSARKSGNTNLATSYEAQNETLNKTIEHEQKLHELRKSTIIQNGKNREFQISQESYLRERTVRKTEFLKSINDIKNLEEAKALLKNDLSTKELNDIKNIEEAKSALRNEFNKEELDKEAKHLENLVNQLNKFLSDSEFKGFDLSLLSPEQKEQFEQQIEDLKLKIQELKDEKSGLQGAASNDQLDLGEAGKMDVLGFTAEDWLNTFSNLDTTADKIKAGSMAVQGFMNAWSMYHKFISAKENKELRKFTSNINAKKARQKSLYDNGLINKRQYDNAIKELEDKAERRKAELEYKQAKRAWTMQLTQAIGNTAMAVINGLNTQPFFPLGIAMGALAGILGGIQIATIAKNKPVKGYEDGFYKVTREQDGKLFNAEFGGESTSGIVDKPTLFLAGEGGKNFPEMIIDGKTMNSLDPDLKNSLYREISRVRGFENGYYQSQSEEAENEKIYFNQEEFNSTMEKVNDVLETLLIEGVRFSKRPRDIQKLNEELEKSKKRTKRNHF